MQENLRHKERERLVDHNETYNHGKRKNSQSDESAADEAASPSKLLHKVVVKDFREKLKELENKKPT